MPKAHKCPGANQERVGPANQSQGAVKHCRQVEITAENAKCTEIELNRASVKNTSNIKKGHVKKNTRLIQKRFYYSDRTRPRGINTVNRYLFLSAPTIYGMYQALSTRFAAQIAQTKRKELKNIGLQGYFSL